MWVVSNILEPIHSSETLAIIYRTKWHHNTEDQNQHLHHSENLKSHIFLNVTVANEMKLCYFQINLSFFRSLPRHGSRLDGYFMTRPSCILWWTEKVWSAELQGLNQTCGKQNKNGDKWMYISTLAMLSQWQQNTNVFQRKKFDMLCLITEKRIGKTVCLLYYLFFCRLSISIIYINWEDIHIQV